jgi:CheY-like chemotaxis protein
MADSARPSKKRVLLVDDEFDILEVCKLLLEFEGFEVATAATGDEALALARCRPPDVVVTDWMMPVMDGVELAYQFKEDPVLCAVPVIMVSAVSRPPDAKPGVLRAFLNKPIDFTALVSAIRASIAGPQAPPTSSGS